MSSATGAIGLGFLAPMLVGPAGVLLIFSGALAFLIGLGMVSTEWMDRTISCGHNALMAAWSGVILFLPIVLLTFVAAADGAFAALLVSVPLCIGCVTLAAVSTLQWTHRIGSLLLSESIVKWAGALQTSALTVAGLVVLTLLIGFYSLDRYYIHPPPSLQLLTTATEIATILGLSLFFAGTAMHLARLALVFRQIKGRCGGLTER